MFHCRTYRHEIKYLLSLTQAKILESRMDRFAVIDKNADGGSYHIGSLYFDDIEENAYYEKENGINNRKKWRIRAYNYDMSMIKLECKHKVGSGVYKESAIISEQEYKNILQKKWEFLKNRKEELLHKFYIELNSNGLRPKVIVNYERVPYVCQYGNVRITFDKNIRAGLGSYSIEDKKIPTINIFPRGEVILEFKYTQYIPIIFQDILFQEIENEIASSKYVLCYHKIQELYE